MNSANLRAYMQEVNRRFCSTEEEMVSYFRGSVDRVRAEEIRGHLSACASCRQVLKDVEEFFTAAEPPLPGDTAEQDFERVWKRVNAATPKKPEASKQLPFELHYLPIAATFLIALVGIGWGGWLQQRLHQSERERARLVDALTTENHQLRSKLDAVQVTGVPRTHVRLVELFPADTYTRDQRASQVGRVVAPSESELVLVLNGHSMVNHPSYQVELFDAEKRLRWRSDNVRRGELGNFVLSLPAAYLGSGRYRIVLTGGTSAKEYNFEIVSR